MGNRRAVDGQEQGNFGPENQAEPADRRHSRGRGERLGTKRAKWASNAELCEPKEGLLIEDEELKEIREQMQGKGGNLLFSNFEKICKAEQSNQKIEVPKLESDAEIQRKTGEVSREVRRVLEVHYNLLFAMSRHCKKSMKQGLHRIQEDILDRHSSKTFQGLLHLIKARVDFKKVANLICLVNFTNHGFRQEEHTEIIFHVVENYPIRCVYILLKMDSFGFFSKQDEISANASRKFQRAKLSIFGERTSKWVSA